MGDHTNIIYRSTWEARVMDKLDKSDWCISWASEETIIPYVSPVDGKRHRYFPDFIVKYRNSQGQTKTMMIEVKPQKQVDPPKKQKRVTKRYITEVATYGVNQAKWAAAKEYCADRGWEFRVLTENDLGL
jgi:TnsA endonuclease N terminal